MDARVTGLVNFGLRFGRLGCAVAFRYLAWPLVGHRLSEGMLFKNVGSGVAHCQQDLADCAGHFALTIVTSPIGRPAGARAERQWAVNRADNIGKADFLGVSAQCVAAEFASMTVYDPALFQIEENLFEKFPGDVRLLGDIRHIMMVSSSIFGFPRTMSARRA